VGGHPPVVTRSKAAQLGATALRTLARPLAYDANRWARLGARDKYAYQAYLTRAKFLAAAKQLADLADELAADERAALLEQARQRSQSDPSVSSVDKKTKANR
jgi:hypothetical protein